MIKTVQGYCLKELALSCNHRFLREYVSNRVLLYVYCASLQITFTSLYSTIFLPLSCCCPLSLFVHLKRQDTGIFLLLSQRILNKARCTPSYFFHICIRSMCWKGICMFSCLANASQMLILWLCGAALGHLLCSLNMSLEIGSSAFMKMCSLSISFLWHEYLTVTLPQRLKNSFYCKNTSTSNSMISVLALWCMLHVNCT